MNVTVSLTSPLLSILFLVEQAIMFGLAGQPGWAVLVPGYCQFIQAKIAGVKRFAGIYITFYVIMLVSLIASMVYVFPRLMTAFVLSVEGVPDLEHQILELFANRTLAYGLVFFFVAAWLAYSIVHLIVLCNIAKRFGHHPGFGVGMFFLPYVFYGLIAFGHETYQPAPEDPDNGTMSDSMVWPS